MEFFAYKKEKYIGKNSDYIIYIYIYNNIDSDTET